MYTHISNWVFLIFAKARQIRGYLLGHMYKSVISAAGGKENLSGSELRFGHTSYSWVKKRELRDLLATMLNTHGLGCLNLQIISSTFNQE